MTTPDQDRDASTDVIVQIKVKLLKVSKAPVWRRLQLRVDTRLLDVDPEAHYPMLAAARAPAHPRTAAARWGYADLKEILTDRSHERHQEMLDWLGLDNLRL
ncbi:MAG: IS1096 element passenger TnpR family protein [Solirubrobacteraceae bacterium]